MRILSCFAICAFAIGVVAFRANAQEVETLSIPIYLINDKAGTGGIEYKIGIMLKLGDSLDNNGYRMYEFDTGGTGFWAAHSPTTNANSWSHNTISSDPISITYASGNILTGKAVTTHITFEAGTTNTNAAYTAEIDTTIARIDTGTNPTKLASNPINQWTTTVDNGDAPIETYFYGDFGMNLASGTMGLFAVVPQLLGTQNTGFTINIGALPDAATVASSTNHIIQTGVLQVGLTAAQRDSSSWSQVIAMEGGTNNPAYPYSGQNTYQEVLAGGTLTLGGTNTYSTGIVYDTGAPGPVIHTGTNNPALTSEIADILTSNPDLILTGSTPNSLILNIAPSGTTPGLNVVTSGTTDAIGYNGLYVNTGIDAFFGKEVVFNVADGFVGINPVPEPGGVALFAGGIFALAGWRLFRRKR